MFLRSLTIRGFKSFAGKTTLEFTPGVSVIVGPNGSGKSNIADAIAWVLGEQGARALRSGQMTDVIFAGSPSKPPLGMAEVRLVIDNSAGLIPVPASEIGISRTIFRTGESEYRLGGRPCRLLDIVELLSDTGMGRALHTLIGQGQLDAVLSARPEERRQFVEEAAGIAKHRRRRERAERKLAGLGGDLLRLQDLVAELRRQLKPLKQQAELAERHEALTKEADEVAVKLAAARLRDLYAERDRRMPTWQEAEWRQAEMRARLSELDAEIARLDGERSAAESAQAQAEEVLAATTEAKSSAEERLRRAIRVESAARERLAAAENHAGRLFALEDELKRMEEGVASVRQSLGESETDLAGADQWFRRAEQERREAEDERRRIGEEQAHRRAEQVALHHALSGHQAEIERLGRELHGVRERLGAAEARAAEMEAEVERLDVAETPLARGQGDLDRERSELAGSLGDLEAEEKGLLARQEVVEARRKELAESPGAGFLRRRPGHAVGLLRELIEVPPHLQFALRTALGAWNDAVVYATQREALSEAAADGGAGLILAVVDDGLTAMEAEQGDPQIIRLPTEPDVPQALTEPALIDLVRPDSRVRTLVARLLTDVHVANNLAEAAARHRVHPDVRFVTPDGTVVGPQFVRTPARHDARLEDVRRESAAIDRELARVRRGLREGRQRTVEVSARLDNVRGDLEVLDRLLTAAAEELGSSRAEANALHREETMLVERLEVVESSAASVGERLAHAPQTGLELPPLPPIPEPPVQLRVEVEGLRRERTRLEAAVDRTRKEVEALASEDPVALRRALSETERDRAEAEEDLRNAEGNLAGAQAAYRATTDGARGAQAAHSDANRTWREVAASADAVREEFEEELRNRQELERRIGDAERTLREGHDVEVAAAMETLAHADTVEELQRRADVVARRLGLLGRVNLLATGELTAVQERHDFIVRELEDVKASRRDLQEVIRDVDRQMAELFATAYSDVAREFSGLFALLFPGGEGRLMLTEPDDLLNSGIEVEARPGRKRVKRLSLLSGGERSLAALAFLFAIFKARPSPFYLMDEVEAALDDVNLVRFLEVVTEFARESQILIVTHQKRTMEVADVLYGVSMGRDGTSAVISQRLAEVATRT